MMLLALAPETSDFLTVWSFVAGVVGCMVGVVGFAYTIYQVRKVQAAAEAAREAATKSLEESKAAYERFVGAFASRLFSELERAINAKDWKLVIVRAQDVAELLATLPASGSESVDSGLTAAVTSLRDLGEEFAVLLEKKEKRLPSRVAKKWSPLRQSLHRQLDQLRKPFREVPRG